MESINEKATPSEGRYQALPLQVPVELRKGWRKKQRHLFLFNDVLIVSNNVHKKKFKVKYVIPLSYLWIGDYQVHCPVLAHEKFCGHLSKLHLHSILGEESMVVSFSLNLLFNLSVVLHVIYCK
ncbi:1700003H04Rik [Phodopus roborovskii]|uniref:1700003H04Rik protein n=1 Tax=Phodopus roborovskii TaxID=109678 RepID=A0AAU9Z8K5_PHORO|nr:1700003H04Rik [Phodopus roborovskii]